MLGTIAFYLITFWPVIFFVAAFWVVMSLVGQATATPKPPAHVDTPEEAVARVAKVKAMMARAEKIRLESLAHHH